MPKMLLSAAVVTGVCLLITRATPATGVEWPDFVVAAVLGVCLLRLWA